MAGKNVKPAAKTKGKGAPGEATKTNETASMPKVKAAEVSNPGEQNQGDVNGAGAIKNTTSSDLQDSDQAQLQASKAHLSSTGSQEQPGTPAAGSAAVSEPAPPGAVPNCFASSSPVSIPGLAVTSSREGFWRCGRQWTKEEQRVALADLNEEQFNQLVDEPVLTVNYVDMAEPAGESA
jgi:hypothetical protein